MLLINVEQARSIDELTIEKHKIPGLLLMENAGKALADEAFSGTDKVYTVVCGCGNNGGDGSVAARHLFSLGANVVLMLVFPLEKLKGDAKRAFDMAVSFGVPVIECLCFDGESRLKKSDVIIDAIFGIGGKNAPEGDVKRIIEIINQSEARVISADVPSGIDSDNGQVPGEAVKADVTLTFGLSKTGLCLYPARSFAGQVKVINIGFSPRAIAQQNILVNSIEGYSFPEISDDDFKGSRGKTLVVAGSSKYGGAAYMSALSALRSGSGIVTLLSPGLKFSSLSPELIYADCKENGGYFSREASETVQSMLPNSTACVAGCGMGVTEGTKKVINDIITNCETTLVLDADGINCIANNKSVLKTRKCDIIMTPHIGEMARFLGISPKKVSENMLGIAKSVAMEYNVVVVLKSASTVIASPTGEAFINTYGTSGMATAGSGDVLAGIVGGFVSQGMPTLLSAVNGVAVHALAGSLAAENKGKHYMSATDIIDGLSLLELKGRENNNDA